MEKTRNDKAFFYVFPTLKVEDDIQILFADVEVKKITTNSRRDFLHVHIFSRHLIQKKQIWQMERRIKDQLFSNVRVDVRIEEEYALSGQYTPEALMNEYRESIILELKEQSVLASSMFSQAQIHFEEGNVICLELLDTIVSEGRREEILSLLENIYRDRFHIPADIRITYREPEGTGTREYDEQRLQQEINAIFERRARQRGEYVPAANAETPSLDHDRAGAAKESGSASATISGGKGTPESGAGGKKSADHHSSGNGGRRSGRKGDFKKKDFYRPIKQGDDPNLIYGRSFDDDPITLDQVVTEMGEITIHGKIINFDTREIRNEKTIIMFAVTDFTDTITVKMFTRNDQLPEILGELKIPGFSEYLHPYGDGLLLGIGMDADEETGATGGMKLSMFDVSDPADVQEKDTFVMENVYSGDVLYDYRAALVDPERNLIGFSAYDGARERYYVFSYDRESGFTCRMEARVSGAGYSAARGLYIGDVLYVVKGNIIEMYRMEDYKKTGDLIL